MTFIYRLRLWVLNLTKPRRCLMCGDKLTGEEWLHEVCDSCYAAEVCAGDCYDEDPHEDELLAEMMAQAEADEESAFNEIMEMRFNSDCEEAL